MLYRFRPRLLVACLLQLGLLTGFYADPATRLLPVVLHGTLLVANSGLLLVGAYQAFQRLRPVAAVVAALLAFPGVLLLVGALVLGSKRL